jgi:hypothetical protein
MLAAVAAVAAAVAGICCDTPVSVLHGQQQAASLASLPAFNCKFSLLCVYLLACLLLLQGC